MRSQLITVVTAVASILLVGQVAGADPVQEQLRLMEQRMAEMEDRLQATSDELRTAKSTVDDQQQLLGEAGLIDVDEQGGLRSGVGNFLEEVNIGGVAAGSFNYRFVGDGDNNLSNPTLVTHPNADTFQVDQIWIELDKEPTEENRAGMHVDFVTGTSATVQDSDTSDHTPYLYSGYVSYLAPIGEGVQIDAGLLPTPLGAEVLRTDQNFNITQGVVWGLQPVTHTGVQLSSNINDELTVTVGMVNDVYSDTFVDDSRDKAYYAQVAFATDNASLAVGAIVGKNSDSDYLDDSGSSCDGGKECKTSVFNVVATAQPGENTSVWADLTWVRNFGRNNLSDGDAIGVSVAGRQQIAEKTGAAFRMEYVRMSPTYMRSLNQSNEIGELMTFTWTGDQMLTDCLTLRGEVRYDLNLANGPLFANDSNNGPDSPGSSGGLTTRDDNVTGLIQLVYGF